MDTTTIIISLAGLLAVTNIMWWCLYSMNNTFDKVKNINLELALNTHAKYKEYVCEIFNLLQEAWKPVNITPYDAESVDTLKASMWQASDESHPRILKNAIERQTLLTKSAQLNVPIAAVRALTAKDENGVEEYHTYEVGGWKD